jgi:adenosylmethionine-8-amino-7-oxononanoate aminotransferase
MNPRHGKYLWHPFTQMKTAQPPLHIIRAKDSMLYCLEGKAYIDAISSWWVNIHGHCNDVIADAISEQVKTLEQVIFAGCTHSPAIQLAENLIGILPGPFAKVFFSYDGSTAVEVALKMAIQYWHNQGLHHKTYIVAFENAYHGDTFGAMSVAERNVFNNAFWPYLFNVIRLPVPNKENFEKVEQQFKTIAEEGNTAAFKFEPLVQGAAGMLMHEANHLDTLIAIAKKNNIVCIADEVMTGFGRTGRNFACEYLQNQPDIVCLSKGITGGFLPLGATVCSQAVFDAFYDADKTKAFFHGHSYTANPIACAAANASIAILQSAKCQEQIKTIGHQHLQFSKTILCHPFVKAVRQKGTILALELKTEEQSSYFNHIQSQAYQYYLSKGVLLRPLGNIVYTMPPYCITQKELGLVHSAIADSLNYLYK